MSLSTFLALPASLLASALAAQSTTTPVPAPQSLLDAFSVSAATTQDISVNQDPASTDLEVQAVIDGQPVVMQLHLHEVRAPGASAWVQDVNGLRQIPLAPCVTYRGALEGVAGSRVAAGYWDGGLRALVWLDLNEPAWGFDPVRRADPLAPMSQHILYRTTDLISQGVCGGAIADTFAAELDGFVPQSSGTDAFEICEIATECDEYLMSVYGDDTTVATNEVTSVVNAMDVIYGQYVELGYVISQMFFNIGSDPYNTTSGPTLLGQFRNYWRNNRNGVPRDVAHLFSGINFDGSVIGVAYLGAICGTNRTYGVSQHIALGFASRVGVTAHELGHNWDSNHCSGSSCYLMCASLGGCGFGIDRFGSSSINQILAYKNSRNCLSPAPGPTLVDASPASVNVLELPEVTLTGTALSTVSEVLIDGVPVPPEDVTIVSPTEIRFVPPLPTSVGPKNIWVTGNGSSNLVPFEYTPVAEPFLEAPIWNPTGPQFPWTLTFASQPGDSWWLFMAPQQLVTVPILGIDFLINSYQLSNGVLDGSGVGGWSIELPVNELHQVVLFTQVVFADPGLTALTATEVEGTIVLD